ncbi:MAG: hypothetical protein J2P52_13825 [Blastocatellia bacterium]|nr:hypothetical protein [Blastocatellia bacterium]
MALSFTITPPLAAQSELAVAELRAPPARKPRCSLERNERGAARRSCVDLAIPTEDGYTALSTSSSRLIWLS